MTGATGASARTASQKRSRCRTSCVPIIVRRRLYAGTMPCVHPLACDDRPLAATAVDIRVRGLESVRLRSRLTRRVTSRQPLIKHRDLAVDTIVVNAEGQITLPAALRHRLGLGSGAD